MTVGLIVDLRHLIRIRRKHGLTTNERLNSYEACEYWCLISTGRADAPARVQALMHTIFEAGTGTSGRATEWSAYQGASNKGRYAATYFKRLQKGVPPRRFPNEVPTICERDAPVEVNLQCLQVRVVAGG